jgi:Transmembrane secretion effector
MNVVQSDSAARPGISAWKPLRQPVFRALWITSLTSNTGTWMHNIGAAWLMTSLTPLAELILTSINSLSAAGRFAFQARAEQTQ